MKILRKKLLIYDSKMENEWEPVFLNKSKHTGGKGKTNQTGKSQLSAIEARYRALESHEVPSDLKPKKISENLRKVFQAARLNKKLTQVELAKQASLDVKIVNGIESGKREFNNNEIKKCEKILGPLQRK
jgi:ribosome-binding protein aMBF1 (putative translation factor)